MYRIGSGAGFSGDRVDAAISVVDAISSFGQGGAVIFETLGERTLALSQIAKNANARSGYEPLLEVILAPILEKAVKSKIVVVGNFGAANPRGAAAAIASLATQSGLVDLKIAVVEGDNLMGKVDIAQAERWEGDRGLPEIEGGLIAINAYIGARAIADAIVAGAHVVVTGRVADPALALGPLVAHFGWDWSDLDRLAAGTLIGHLLECGSQVSGGYFADPGLKDVPHPENIGFPIAEVSADGSFVVTKASGTGGVVDLRTVKEQLLYEIHDPAAYLTPDVTLDLTQVEVRSDGLDRVRVSGAKGHPSPAKLKATASFHGDYLGEAEISYAGQNALARCRLAVSTIAGRISRRGIDVRARSDIVGTVSAFDADGGELTEAFEDNAGEDYRVRFAFASRSEEAVKQAVAEVNALYCCGPAGGGGVRTNVRARVRTLSYLVPREAAATSFHFHEA